MVFSCGSALGAAVAASSGLLLGVSFCGGGAEWGTSGSGTVEMESDTSMQSVSLD